MASMDIIFDMKYVEFANELQATFQELETEIKAAIRLDTEARKSEFKKQVLPSCSPTRDATKCPGLVLPGVVIPQALWETISTRSKKAIQEHMTVLSFTFLMDEGKAGDVPGASAGWTADWAKNMMDDMKEKMKHLDFSDISSKIAGLFGSASSDGFPKLPEKFMNGQIARLAEEIVKELKMEDFGIDPATMESAGNDPTKALGIIMELLTKNPAALQNTIGKLTKKIQSKIQSGAIRPSELVAEAEELMKTFSENPQFVGLMESFRQSFGAFNDPDVARATNREPENRLNIVKERLRKKLEARKNGKK